LREERFSTIAKENVEAEAVSRDDATDVISVRLGRGADARGRIPGAHPGRIEEATLPFESGRSIH